MTTSSLNNASPNLKKLFVSLSAWFSLNAALLFSSVFAQEADIDWDHVRVLFRKEKAGQTLSEEERQFLNEAMALRESRASRNTDHTMRGDGVGEKSTVAPIDISLEESPVLELDAAASDGHEFRFACRIPAADRPLPAIVFIHGGLGQRQIRELNENTRTNPTLTRFLDRGYVIAAATFRTYGNTPTSPGPILDALAVIAEVRRLPQVDPESIIIYGGSGGGSIALELASSEIASPVAVVAGEPATVLYTGLMTELAMREPAMRDFANLYGERQRAATEAKISRISCPILIHHGDVHLLKRINFELVFPAIEHAGKQITVLTYPGEQHGFYWGYHTSEQTLNRVVRSTFEFIEPLLKSAPVDSGSI